MKKVPVLKAFLLFLLLSGHLNYINAQVGATVTTGTTAVQNLVGSGIIVSNIQTFTTSPNGIGLFTNGNSGNLGINNGIFLFTGDVSTAGPQLGNLPATFVSTDVGTPGDADLDALSFPTFNASILQFDFIPTGDTIKFRYVFASEEYNEFVNAGVNDVFGFFLTGPNPFGPAYTSQNIALIPNTTTPVAIDNVNNGNTFGCATGPCTNCSYYVDNLCNNNNFCFDGHTVVLTAIAPVVACSTYTIKLAIADVGDGIYDSGVFLEAGSFTSNLVTIASATSFTNGSPGLIDTLLWEGCNSADLFFIRQGDLSGTDTIIFTVGGTATMGSDYNSFNDTIIFQSGQDTIPLSIFALDDGPGDAGETIVITINDTICNNPAYTSITLYIDEVSPITATSGPDSLFCEGTSILFDINPTGGSGVYTITWTDPSGNNFADSLNFAPTQSGYYNVSVYEYCNDTTAYDSLYLDIYPVPNINLTDENACINNPVIIGPSSSLGGFNYQWSPSTYLNQTNIYNPTMTPTAGGIFTYYLSVDSAGVVCYSDSMQVQIFNAQNFDMQPDSIILCQGSQFALTAPIGFSNYLWSTGSTNFGINVSSAGIYSVSANDVNNCIYTDSAIAIIFPIVATNLADQQLCSGDTISIGVTNGSNNYHYNWSTAANINDSTVANPYFTYSLNDGSTPLTFTYALVVDSGGVSCNGDTMQVVVFSNPIVDLGTDSTTLCENNTLTLDAGSGQTYMWNTGANSQTIDVDTTGTYSVLLTDVNGCSNEDSIYVGLILLPRFSLDTAYICQGDTAVFFVPSATGDSYLWQTGATDTIIWVSQGGAYWLQVTNQCGTSSDTALVLEQPNIMNIELPNVLTPNGDGFNDEYLIPALVNADSFRLDIFNRWGRLLFSTTDFNEVWKGEGDGGTVTAGTYFVVLTFTNCYGVEFQKNDIIQVILN